ncbi:MULTISPECIES: excalibur calcium-binding domain-containing protein [Luteimonas]|uniref:excalibur calcium-binding domain-containing protein n=1 Tax=Luteimonas TaxID=83614 RepID=UPI000C7E793D|nr:MULTISPECIES: excalibur calcium-binding domain-containing protein [Luteimonas]
MTRLVMLLILGLAVWAGYRYFNPSEPTMAAPVAATSTVRPSTPERVLPRPAQTFSCDGRQHCSQMRSCEEATFFIRNCPDTKMDGNHDGVPCEAQWCG